MNTSLFILLEVTPPGIILLCAVILVLTILALRWSDRNDKRNLENQCRFMKSFLDTLESEPNHQVTKVQISDFAEGSLECSPEAFHQWVTFYPKYAEMLKAICIMVADFRTNQTPMVVIQPSEGNSLGTPLSYPEFGKKIISKEETQKLIEKSVTETLASLGFKILEN